MSTGRSKRLTREGLTNWMRQAFAGWDARDALRGSAVGLAAAVAAVGLRVVLEPWLGVRQPFILVYFAAMAVALRWGLIPGLVCTIVGISAGAWLVLEPARRVDATPLWHPTVAAALICAAMVLLADRHRAQRMKVAATAAAAREREARYRTTYENAPIGIGRTDLAGRWLDANGSMAGLLGCRPEELLGRSVLEFTHPADVAQERARLSELAAGRAGSSMLEKRLVRADGALVWVSTTVAPLRDEAGRPTSLVRIAEDISQRRRAEQALQRRHRDMTVLAETAADLLTGDDPRGFLDGVYRRLADHLGVEMYFHFVVDPGGDGLRLAAYGGVDEQTARQIDRLGMGEAICGRVAAQCRPIVLDHVQTASGSLTEAAEFIRRQGVTAYACHPLLAGGRLVGTLSFGSRTQPQFDADAMSLMRAVATQVAAAVERAQRAEALSHQLRVTATITENATQALFLLDSRGYCTHMNPAAEEMLGYRLEEVRDRPLHEYIQHSKPDGSPRPMDDGPIGRVLGGGPALSGLEETFIRRDGGMFPVLCSASPIHHDGRTVGMVLEAQDISSREAAQRAIRESEARSRALTEATFDAIAMHDQGAIVEINDSFEEMFGYGREEVIGRQMMDVLVDAGSRQRVRDSIASGSEIPYEATLVRKDGSRFQAEIRAREITYGGRRLRVVSTRDITARKRAEEELARNRDHLQEILRKRTAELERSHERLRLSERLASLGTLAAGLGHDMGNLLLPLRARLESLESEARTDLEREDIEAIRKAAEYLQRLTHGLRLLALDPDESSGGPASTDLREWWPDAEPLLRNALPRGITLEESIPDGPLRVAMTRAGVTQAIFNLVQNAGQALAGRGQGWVRVWAEPTADGQGVRLGVTDNGPGMSEEVRRRCLEPFFTTRARTHGTGMGLALVHATVRRIGGSIDVLSEPGQGATFILTLPTALPPPSRQPGAAVTIEDQRLRSFVQMLMESHSFEIRAPEAAGVCLWITDREAASPERVAAFLEADPAHQVVMLGDGDWWPKGLPRDRVQQLERPPRPARLREAIRSAASSCGAAGPRLVH